MKVWKISVNGKENEVIFTPNRWSGKHRLTINGKDIELKKSPFQVFVGIDQPIHIAGKECRFVLIGNKADIAVDGTYVDSKKMYVPLNSMPWWTWIFIVACIAVPIVSLGGALPVLIALICSAWCVRVSVSPGIHASIRVLCCFGISVLAWGLLGVLIFVMSSI
ncbi:MAG: hypothetical protein PUB22_04710 [Clostridiales bacterium]|nr:hypothetical protein [Clostridiales bacterium]